MCVFTIECAPACAGTNRALGPAEDFDGPVMVLAVNYRYLALMLNWMCGRRKAGLGSALEDAVLVAQDARSYAYLTRLGFNAVIDPEVHFGPIAHKADGHVTTQSMLFCVLHQVRESGGCGDTQREVPGSAGQGACGGRPPWNNCCGRSCWGGEVQRC